MLFISLRKPVIKRATLARIMQGIKSQTGKLPPEQREAEAHRRFVRARSRHIAKTALDFSNVKESKKRAAVIEATQAFVAEIDPLIPKAHDPAIERRLDEIDVRFKRNILRILGAEEAGKFLKNYQEIEIE